MIETFAWIGTFLQFVGVYLNTQKRRSCWWVWIVASGIMLVYAVIQGSWPTAGLFAGYEVLNVYGLISWRPKPADPQYLRDYLLLRTRRLEEQVGRLKHRRRRLLVKLVRMTRRRIQAEAVGRKAQCLLFRYAATAALLSEDQTSSWDWIGMMEETMPILTPYQQTLLQKEMAEIAARHQTDEQSTEGSTS